MRSPVVWVGGKGHMIKKLLPLMPEHKTYVEVFGGGASLLFAKEPPKDNKHLEIYNDIDSGLYNFFYVLRYHSDELKKKLDFPFIYSREHYYFCRNTWRDCEDKIEKAYRWFVVARQSFGGDLFNGRWRYEKSGRGSAVTWQNVIQQLPIFAKRFQHVQVDNRDFRTILKVYNQKTTFFYIDPPYLMQTRKKRVYDHELNNEDHEDLIKILKDIKGKVLLSGHDNALYNTLRWNKKSWDISLSVMKNRIGKKRTETVWYNYDI